MLDREFTLSCLGDLIGRVFSSHAGERLRLSDGFKRRCDTVSLTGYSFRPLTRADLLMAARWLQTPEVSQWWGDPDEQLALLTEDLDEPRMRQWIVESDGRPFAYVQAYAPASWPQPHFHDLPADSAAIDAFIGEPDMIGRGHGSAVLRVFAQMLIEDGASAVVIDPDADNLRARRAYAQAGFVEDRSGDTADGRTIVMVFPGTNAAR